VVLAAHKRLPVTDEVDSGTVLERDVDCRVVLVAVGVTPL
jgi:hypothetical protein